MLRRPPRSTRTDTLFPYTTLFRSQRFGGGLPKQYATLAGMPLLRHTLRAFAAHPAVGTVRAVIHPDDRALYDARSEEHTSELQSLMRISYAVFCLKKKKKEPRSHRIKK